ncbi:exosortase H [Brevundimonas sp. DC300-4]|uniref:exosortase H n=1 Tax=Brevundimonas sp. DC300-4 TaxID=2804594 RepID=UPI003CE6D68D
MLKSPAVRYLGLFLLLTVALFSVLATPWAERLFTAPFTRGLVDVCAALTGMADHRVRAAGDVLSFADGRGAVQVLAGCNAVEVCALLTAAIIAFPGKLKYGLIGAAAGVAALQTVNLLRIISLLYLSRGSQEVFEFFHNYLWDALIGLEGLLVFFFWTRWQARQTAASPPTDVSGPEATA